MARKNYIVGLVPTWTLFFQALVSKQNVLSSLSLVPGGSCRKSPASTSWIPPKGRSLPLTARATASCVLG